MAQGFFKKVKYNFATASELEVAKQELDTKYPHLRTSHCESIGGGFSLFVESTRSLIYDSFVECLLKNCGGIRVE